MIVFDLKCAEGHAFEAWFKSSDAFEGQQRAGLLECPHCGNREISRGFSAPKIGGKAQGRDEERPGDAATPSPEAPAEAMAMNLPAELATKMEEFRRHVEANTEDVGRDFAEKARSIHYGESEERAIRGEATLEEARDLTDEGIDILPLPPRPKSN